MIILGIDYGQQRTGVAASDPTGLLASPVCVIEGLGKRKLVQRIASLAQEKQACKIVLGLPLRTDGTAGDKAQECTKLAELLHQQSGLEVVLWDERFSTTIAHQQLGAAGVRAKNRKSIVDAAAAVVILQSYLDSRA
ncbi:MAG: Holliday junction resolvase RuvX [Oscillospiraceae bacterium]|nr:Holliday junction resolvase RuvX [Oscillospiraceae bacterium]